MKKEKREAAAQRRPARIERKNGVFSAKRQAVWFETQCVSNRKCSNETRRGRVCGELGLFSGERYPDGCFVLDSPDGDAYKLFKVEKFNFIF